MIKPVSKLEKDAMTAISRPAHNWVHVCTIVLAGIAIVSSAFHFWPFENSKAWQMLCAPNLVASIGILALVGCVLLKRDRQAAASLLPHVSVFAYLSVNILSIAFASEPGRAAGFTVKLALMLLGGYALFSAAISNIRSLKIFYNLMTAAVIVSVAYCLVARFCLGSKAFGFHGSAYKYGTYVGILAPLCAAYFFAGSKSWKIILGIIISVCALVSSGTLGALAAISAGMLAATITIARWPTRFCILGSLAIGFGGLSVISNLNPASDIRDELRLTETDEVNLKQRYIEWQAEINLLEERTITGTGAGCINDYRSNFYYRLPKLNTLKAFDQNGWLATGAETGIVGLMCFCWIALYYGRAALVQVVDSEPKQSNVDRRFAVANFAGFVAACVANLFSSVHYNGILIVFVLVLTLISRTNFPENQQDAD
jgi:hypothetical protein